MRWLAWAKKKYFSGAHTLGKVTFFQEGDYPFDDNDWVRMPWLDQPDDEVEEKANDRP